MTVREAVSVLIYAKRIILAWDGTSNELETTDPLTMDAFGDYAVRYITTCDRTRDSEAYEIGIKVMPVKEARP